MKTIELNNGVNTVVAPRKLRPGELQLASGCVYRPGDHESIDRLGGRKLHSSPGVSGRVKDLALCVFDTGGISRLLSYLGTTIYSVAISGGTPTPFITGLSSSGVELGCAPFNDRWYVGNGYDGNRCIESDGTVRLMSMVAPPEAPAINPATGAGSVGRPTAETNAGFVNPSYARDADVGTYAYARLSTAGSATCIWTGYGADATAGRQLELKWALGSLPPESDFSPDAPGTGTGAEDYVVVVTFYVSQDAGANFSVVYTGTIHGKFSAVQTTTVPIAANSNQVQVRATFQFVSGTIASALRVYDTPIRPSGAGVNFSTSVGIYYAMSEYDALRDLESEYVVSGRVTMANQNYNSLAWTAGPKNPTATHWRIYRTIDGGTAPQDLRLIASVQIALQSYIDNFSIDKDTRGTASPMLLKLQPDPDQPAQYFPANSAAPTLSHINAYGSFLVGLAPGKPRSLYYCLPGYPEYWPAIYVVDSFPLAERDELVVTATCGDSLIVGAKEALLVLDGLEIVSSGRMQTASARPMRGQPGCVGSKAMVAFSVSGEPRAAWISPLGVHITNGQTASRISYDIDWDAATGGFVQPNARLCWDKKNECLIVCLDSDGDGLNDQMWYVSMDETAAEDNLKPVRWLGPTVGRTSALISGLLNGVPTTLSGNSTDGNVYVEDSTDTGADESQAYSGTNWLTRITSPTMYAGHSDQDVDVANVSHSAFDDDAAVATLSWRRGSDRFDTVTTIEKSFPISVRKGSNLYIGRLAEWHEFTITSIGTWRGRFKDVRVEADVADTAG